MLYNRLLQLECVHGRPLGNVDDFKVDLVDLALHLYQIATPARRHLAWRLAAVCLPLLSLLCVLSE